MRFSEYPFLRRQREKERRAVRGEKLQFAVGMSCVLRRRENGCAGEVRRATGARKRNDFLKIICETGWILPQYSCNIKGLEAKFANL